MALVVRAKRGYRWTLSNSQLRYVEFDDYDCSCQAPVLVLDVNEGDAGYVRKAFTPYFVAVNREQAFPSWLKRPRCGT